MEKISNKQQVVYGLRPVMEAIDSGAQIERVLLQKDLSGVLASELRNKLRNREIPFQYVPAEKLNKLTSGNHQGVVATLAAIRYKSFMELVEQEDAPQLVVLLDHITDVRNMGAIARTAECTGVGALVVPDHGSAAMLRTSVIWSNSTTSCGASSCSTSSIKLL